MKNFIAVLLITLSSGLAFAKTAPQMIQLTVTEHGFEPKSVDVKPGAPVILKITRTTDSTCAKQIQVPVKKIKKDLPLNKEVAIEIGSLEKGEIRFGCGMGMMQSGTIFVK